MIPLRVLVTGASGFVGRAIVAELVARGHAVRAATRAAPSTDPAVEHVAIGDLAEPVAWEPLLEGVHAVVHAAGCPQQTRAISDARLFRINAEATERLATAAARCGVGRFVFVSSVRAICGATSPTVVGDDAVPAPTNAYGRSKLAGEQAVQAGGRNAVSVRPVMVHGAGAGANLRMLVRLAASPFPLPLAGFSGRRSLVSDRNLADAVAFLAEGRGADRRTLLVADAEPMTVPALITTLRAARGRSASLFALPAPLLAGLSRWDRRGAVLDRLAGDMVVSCDALAALGWSAPEPSSRGLARMVGAGTAEPARLFRNGDGADDRSQGG